MEPAVKGRSYSTVLRQEQAQLTRRRVLEAARRLFIARGYGAVTMQEIAREARVAYQTVYAQFGNKLRLAVELCDSEVLHVGPTVASLAALRAAGDPRAWVRGLGGFARRLYEPCAEVLRFMARSGDEALLGRLQEIEAARLGLLKDLGPQLEQSNRLRAGIPAAAAVDVAWALTAPDVYTRLVLDRGWTPERYQRWLEQALAGLLIGGR